MIPCIRTRENNWINESFAACQHDDGGILWHCGRRIIFFFNHDLLWTAILVDLGGVYYSGRTFMLLTSLHVGKYTGRSPLKLFERLCHLDGALRHNFPICHSIGPFDLSPSRVYLEGYFTSSDRWECLTFPTEYMDLITNSMAFSDALAVVARFFTLSRFSR